MVRLIYGAKGSGKTGIIVNEANNRAVENDSVVFLTNTWRYRFDIKHEVRLINALDYDICTELGFTGFIRGILASNNDIHLMYIDGAHRLVCKEIAEMESFYEALDTIAKKCKVEIVVTVSVDKLPDFLNKYEKEKA
ncbi:MAG: hypothetical protein EOM87_03805 [Clostridia bacterium]|nr:hypothetical protein [Clostridia bacterium]